MSALAKIANQAVFEEKVKMKQKQILSKVEMNNVLLGYDDSTIMASIFIFVETISGWQRAMPPLQ